MAHGGKKIGTYASEDFGGSGAPVIVCLFDDDYTPMEFVVETLITVMSIPSEEARSTALRIDQDGAAVCGVYQFCDAVNRLDQIHQLARVHGHPLRGYLQAGVPAHPVT